jgi:DNA-binding Lrp family transcriptional regulator
MEISGDMPLSPEPFKRVAHAVGISVEEVLVRLKRMSDEGALKRIAPILYHQKTTFTKNALTIWAIDERDVERVAAFFVSFTHISHVYERETCAEWPYNLYGMIHAKSDEELESVIGQIKEHVGNVPFKVITTLKEWKKTSPNLAYLLGGC